MHPAHGVSQLFRWRIFYDKAARARVEGADRKSFFAIAESKNGVDNFRFWDEPIDLPDDAQITASVAQSIEAFLRIYPLRGAGPFNALALRPAVLSLP